MKFILFLMFFTTPAVAPPPPGVEPKEKVWALQSTSSMEFATEVACHAIGDKITKSLEPVATLTVRGWCFCESQGSQKCPQPIEPKPKPKPPGFLMTQPGDSVGATELLPPKFK